MNSLFIMILRLADSLCFFHSLHCSYTLHTCTGWPGFGGVKLICELFLACVFLFLAYNDTIFSRFYIFLGKFDDFPRFFPSFFYFKPNFFLFLPDFPIFFPLSLFSPPTLCIFPRLGGGVETPPPCASMTLPQSKLPFCTSIEYKLSN